VSAWFGRRPVVSTVTGIALEAVTAAFFNRIDVSAFVGVPGAVGVLIAVTVGLVAGAVPGAVTAVVGALLYATLVSEVHGSRGVEGAIALVVLWAVAAAIAGSTAARQRRRTAAALADLRASTSEAEALSVAFERILESTPVFHTRGQREDVAAAMCSTALETFGCDRASLWSVEGGELRLLATRPPAEEGMQTRVVLADLPAVRRVVAQGQPAFVPDLASEPGMPALGTAGSGLRSVLRVPVAVGGEVAHVLGLGWAARVDPPTRETMVVAQRFADQASLALEQSRLREAESEVAELHRRLETGLLPTLEVHDAGVEIATRYQAGEDRLLLGGDFYDAIELRDRAIALLVGDVSGSGPTSAAIGASLRAAWRGLVLAGSDASTLLSTLQALLERDRLTPETFVTCCCIWIWPDRQGCTVALAGHPPPLLMVPGSIRPLAAAAGAPLGATSGAQWRSSEFELPPRWRILLYTDGLIEGRALAGSNERLGQDGLVRLLQSLDAVGSDPLGGGLDRLLAHVKQANGDRFVDDVALLYAALVE
jgi:serine phosphatase RsbU (regulator of sigma subunit)